MTNIYLSINSSVHLLGKVETYDTDMKLASILDNQNISMCQISLTQYNIYIVILSLNSQSINAKYDELNIFFTNIILQFYVSSHDYFMVVAMTTICRHAYSIRLHLF